MESKRRLVHASPAFAPGERHLRGARFAGTVLLFCAALLAVAVPARGTEFYWGNPEPQGNPVRSIAMVDDLVGVAVGLHGTVLRTTDAGETWEDRTHWGSFPAGLYCVRRLPDGSLLAVGDSPGVFRSTDLGESWIPVANPSTASLLHLTAAGGQVYSAVGRGGRVIRSTDGGATWTAKPSPGNADLVDQFWSDSQNGYVIGPDLVRHTTNGGQTWSSLPGVQENFFLPGDIQFLDSLNGWVMVDATTWRTTNGGLIWFQKQGSFGGFPIYQQEAVFLDATTRLVCTEGEGADIWKTTDDGLSWERKYQQQTVTGYSDLLRLPSGRLLAASTGGDLLRSDDGGSTWIDFTNCATGSERSRLEASCALSDGRCFAGGDGSAWLASADFGRTWTAPPAHPGISTIYSIAFRGSLGLAAGYTGGGPSRIARTTDGGISWTLPTLSPTYAGGGVSVSQPDDQTAFVATYGGSSVNYVFRSTDGGASWHLRNNGLPVNVRFNTLFFLDPQTGFLGGGDFGDAAVWKTTDGGGQWTQLAGAGLSSYGVDDLHWFNSSRGVAATIGRIYLTTNGGATWSTTCTGCYNRIAFSDGQHGYASSLYHEYFETTDGGSTWATHPLPFEPFYYELAATASGVILVGDGSSVFGVDQGAAGLPEPPPGVTARGGLHLTAFPNPSYGPVGLTFESVSPGVARLEVFDLQGRRMDVRTASVPRGAGSIWWNPAISSLSRSSAVAAGVYLARLTAPDGAVGSCRFVLVGPR